MTSTVRWWEGSKLEESVEVLQAKMRLLEYLMDVAVKTGGSEVWRALFAEMRSNVQERLVKK